MNHADGYDADGGLSMTISFAPERGDGVGGWKSVMGEAECPFFTRSHARSIDKRRVQDAAECRLLHGHINKLNNEQ